MGKPLRRLHARIVLEKALVFEEHAYHYYHAILGLTTMSNSFDLLKKISGQKLRAIIMLKEMQRKGRVKNIEFSVDKRYGHDSLTSTDLDTLCEEWPNLKPDDSPDTILRYALQKEKCACLFYRKLIQRTRHTDIHEVFQNLLHEGEEHARDIEKELKTITA